MLFNRQREWNVDGIHLENMDEIYYLKGILGIQEKILEKLNYIDTHVVKYFGEQYDLQEEELKQKMSNAKFTREQLQVIQEVINHTKQKYTNGSGTK